MWTISGRGIKRFSKGLTFVVRLTRRYQFSASHRLHTDALSKEENARLFGKCNYPFGHGHNYVLEVSVAGEPDAVSGMVMRRDTLDDFVGRTALGRIDHTYLNQDVEEFRQTVATTENLSLVVHRWLAAAWDAEFGDTRAKLDRIRIEETARNSFEVTS